MFLPDNFKILSVIHHKCCSNTSGVRATFARHFPVVKSGHHFITDLEQGGKVGASVVGDETVYYVVDVHVLSGYQVNSAARCEN